MCLQLDPNVINGAGAKKLKLICPWPFCPSTAFMEGEEKRKRLSQGLSNTAISLKGAERQMFFLFFLLDSQASCFPLIPVTKLS